MGPNLNLALGQRILVLMVSMNGRSKLKWSFGSNKSQTVISCLGKLHPNPHKKNELAKEPKKGRPSSPNQKIVFFGLQCKNGNYKRTLNPEKRVSAIHHQIPQSWNPLQMAF